jgi:type VI protein secretion system component Hcp
MRRIFVFGILVGALLATTGHTACTPGPGGLLILVEGIRGDSTNPSCRDLIELVSARINPSGTAGSLTLVKGFDRASGPLMNKLVSGAHIQSANLYAMIQGNVVEYEFSDLLLSSFRQSANPATETITIDFAKFERKEPTPKTLTHSTSDRQAPAVSTSALRSGPIVLNGSSSPRSFPVSMKFDDQPVSLTGTTFTARRKPNGRVEAQMIANSSAYSQFAAAPVSKAVITFAKPDGTPFAGYTLREVRVSGRGGQTILGFDKIDWQLIIPGEPSAPSGWNLGSNTAS